MVRVFYRIGITTMLILFGWLTQVGEVQADRVDYVSDWQAFQTAWELDEANQLIILEEDIEADEVPPLQARQQPVVIMGDDIELALVGTQTLASTSSISLVGTLKLLASDYGSVISADLLEIAEQSVISLDGFNDQPLLQAKRLVVNGAVALSGGNAACALVDDVQVNQDGIMEAFATTGYPILVGHGQVVVAGGRLVGTGGGPLMPVISGDYAEVRVEPDGELVLHGKGPVIRWSGAHTTYRVMDTGKLTLNGLTTTPVVQSVAESNGGISIENGGELWVKGRANVLFDLQQMCFLKIVQPRRLTLENNQTDGTLFGLGAARYEFWETELTATMKDDRQLQTSGLTQLTQRGMGPGKSNQAFQRLYQLPIRKFLGTVRQLQSEGLNREPLKLTATPLVFGGGHRLPVQEDLWLPQLAAKPVILSGESLANAQVQVSQVTPFTNQAGNVLLAVMWANQQPILPGQTVAIAGTDVANAAFKLQVPPQAQGQVGDYQATYRFQVVVGPTG